MNPSDRSPELVESGALPQAAAEHSSVPPTPLAAALAHDDLLPHCGVSTPRGFTSLPGELGALLRGAGMSDAGWRGKILVTGSDRIRWMNGMVSNTIQALPEGEGNYSFLLSVQGRIQGDGWVHRRSGDLVLDTGRDQVPALLKHLEHFVIMDDVELADASEQWTTLSLAGPAAPRVLATLGVPGSGTPGPNARMHHALLGETDCILIELPQIAVPRYELWFAPAAVGAVWETLEAAGAQACGLEATEALRVLEGVPLYGLDINDRDLPQETAQTRALNFSKGCYLGQEIVERIRSRGKVNRRLQQFSLGGQPVSLPADLISAGQPVGRITSKASLPEGGTVGLGFVRLDAVERQAEILCEGAATTVLTAPALRPTTT